MLLRALDYYDDGRIVETYTETRYVSGNGDWRSVKQFHGGPVKESVGIVGRGVFAVEKKEKKLRFRLPYSTNYVAEMVSGSRAGKLVMGRSIQPRDIPR
jgi:hypothetical protein